MRSEELKLKFIECIQSRDVKSIMTLYNDELSIISNSKDPSQLKYSNGLWFRAISDALKEVKSGESWIHPTLFRDIMMTLNKDLPQIKVAEKLFNIKLSDINKIEYELINLVRSIPNT